MNREDLIEQAGRRLFGATVDSMDRARELAGLVLAVFEKATAPTDDGRRGVIGCRCDGGVYGPQAHPFLVHPECPIHATDREDGSRDDG